MTYEGKNYIYYSDCTTPQTANFDDRTLAALLLWGMPVTEYQEILEARGYQGIPYSMCENLWDSEGTTL